SGSYGFLAFYEIRGLDLAKMQFPEMHPRYKKKYMGHDRFTVTDKHIKHSFPVYEKSDPNCCPTGGTATITYIFENNEFKEIAYEVQHDNAEKK
ncbi:hypothetical protein ACFL9T_23720, partial [Thermodesulfobacteriota bacterium]